MEYSEIYDDYTFILSAVDDAGLFNTIWHMNSNLEKKYCSNPDVNKLQILTV